MSLLNGSIDVLVVGAGNAAFSAAVSASENGARVLMLECASPEEAHGNSRFTAGSMRFAYDGIEDLRRLMPDLTDEQVARTDFGSYTAEQYRRDLARLSDDRCDPVIADLLVERSKSTLLWMRDRGIGFVPQYAGQSIEKDGKARFFGGSTVEVVGGGIGLVEGWKRVAEEKGVRILYGARATDLLVEAGDVRGVRATVDNRSVEIEAGAVVLASGGFEANAEWRKRYLGEGWERAKVRGSRHNNGDGIRMALEVGAARHGFWSGCHAVGWDVNAPDFGDYIVRNRFQKHSYPFGITLNQRGERFIDEASEFRNYTYANYGKAVLAQPGRVAWQVFDGKMLHLLRDEYRIPQATRVAAETLPELVAKMVGIDQRQALATIAAFNKAVRTDVPFDASIEDRRGTVGLAVPKSNWATTIDTPPFEAYGITCGITFTYGGLRINESAEVLTSDAGPICGLHAAGELVGGLFYSNYPGGAGLTAGAVFGRIAGASAATHSRRVRGRPRSVSQRAG